MKNVNRTSTFIITVTQSILKNSYMVSCDFFLIFKEKTYKYLKTLKKLFR